MSVWLRAINRVLNGAHVQLRQLPQGHHADAFEEQRRVLARRKVQVVFDVGANVGVTAKRYAGLFPEAQIHCFEPFPDSHDALTRAFPSSQRVHAHAVALSAEVGTRTFYVNKASVTNSLFPTSETYRERHARSDITTTTGSITVPTTTLDEFCSQHGIEHIDVLKLDIQGGELLALRGAERLLRASAIDVIYSEVTFSPIYEGQAFFHDLAPLLFERGYHLYNLYPLTYTRNGLASWTDALWISRSIERALPAVQ
ncbi:MAG TPA: FkbM family methyltransferase [Polyangiaceae bacterium]|nr:FkbM family methyltransferase [Polyangiaceae bacterium]